MKSFKFFGFKRKLEILSSGERFFELHSRATERKKDKNMAENINFSAN
jgi:hypothetical protein